MGLRGISPSTQHQSGERFSEEYKSDVILKPNQFASNRYPMPKLNANVDPTLLEFKIARPDISFAEGQSE